MTDEVLSIAASAGVVIDAPSKTLKLQQGLAYARRSLWGVNGDLPMLRRDCIGRSLQPMSLQWVMNSRAHSRDQFAYDRKPLKADVISPRRLVLPRMLPVLSNRGVRPCLTMNQSR